MKQKGGVGYPKYKRGSIHNIALLDRRVTRPIGNNIPRICESNRGVGTDGPNFVLHSLDHPGQLVPRQFLSIDVLGADGDSEDLVGVFREGLGESVRLILEQVVGASRPDPNDGFGPGRLERGGERLECIALRSRIDADNGGAGLGLDNLEIGGEVFGSFAGLVLLVVPHYC